MPRRSTSAGPSVSVRLPVALAGRADTAAGMCRPPLNLGQYVEQAVAEKLERHRAALIDQQFAEFNRTRSANREPTMHRHEWDALRLKP
jgi:hypothetical protein